MKRLLLTFVVWLSWALLSAPANANDACRNLDVAAILPSGSGAYIVVKNYGSEVADGKVQVEFVNDYGTVLDGPKLYVPLLSGKGSTRLYTYVPSYAKTVNARIDCSN